MKSKFEDEYWKEIYSKYSIEADYNPKKHSEYIAAYFSLHSISIKSILDIGFGNANLLKEIAEQFKVERIIAIDISEIKTKQLLEKNWIQKYFIAVLQKDFLDYNSNYLKELPVDLAICNSVIQYVKEVEAFLEKLAIYSKYVYFSVPTQEDYFNLKNKFGFEDRFAYSRKKEFYLKLINKYFRVIGYNLLESKKLLAYSSIKEEFFVY